MVNSDPNDATIDTDVSSSDVSDVSGRPDRPRVRLVEGEQSGCSWDTSPLLHRRLMVASTVMSAGFGVFVVWRLLGSVFSLDPPTTDSIFLAQVLMTSVLMVCALVLWRQECLTTRMLRVIEFVVFGTPAVFFFAAQFLMMRHCAVHEKMLPNAGSPWVILIFTYGMFIPNSWRRAAVVIGSMALLPIVLTLTLWATDHVCARLIQEDLWTMVVAGLAMLFSGTVAVIGVHTINTLRIEALEASQLGQYRLGRLLGSGGMGEVYLAEHLLMKRPCAIKIIRPEKAGNRRVLARFEREVRATAKLSHWNTIDIYDYGRAADGTFYYVMEYLPGLSLAQMVASYGPLAPERVIFLLSQTCDALSEAHAAGLIHRDIKPANIFVARRGGHYDVAKLLDFGMVKPMGGIESVDLSIEGSITGSPLFMSPEQALGTREPDVRSDIYSLGVVGYFLLSGRPPFESQRPIQVLFSHANQKPVPLSIVARGVPKDLESVIMRCMEKQPEDRYQSAAELHAAMQACKSSGAWTFIEAANWWSHLDNSPETRVSWEYEPAPSACS